MASIGNCFVALSSGVQLAADYRQFDYLNLPNLLATEKAMSKTKLKKLMQMSTRLVFSSKIYCNE